MTERDPLNTLLREWKAPEPTPGMDERVVDAYRAAFPPRTPAWRGFWKMRISIPVPILLAAMVVFALLLWFRSTPAPNVSGDAGEIVTRLNATGFQPLPNGEARIVPIKETTR
jgi:hypothetical protein